MQRFEKELPVVTYTPLEPEEVINLQLMEEREPITPKKQSPTQVVGSVLNELILEEEEEEHAESLGANK